MASPTVLGCGLFVIFLQVLIPACDGYNYLCYCTNDNNQQKPQVPQPQPQPQPQPEPPQKSEDSEESNDEEEEEEGEDEEEEEEEEEEKEKDDDKCDWCMRGTCKPAGCTAAKDFSAAKDAEDIQEAVKNLGTNEKKMYNILAHRSDEQIEAIRKEYIRSGSTLPQDIVGDTSCKTKDLMLALQTPRPLFYAEQLEHAFKHGDTDTMIEIFASLSDCAIREVAVEYEKRFHKAMPDSIKKETCLDFEKFLLELAKGNRPEGKEVDVEKAKKDANDLVKAGVDKWFGTDESTFINIFATRSFAQLNETLKQYDNLRSEGIVHDIKKSTTDKLQKGLLTLVKNIRDQPGYFADELEGSLDSLILPGPKDNNKLIRIMRGRCGLDLGDIQDAFPKNHDNKALSDRISKKTYFDYQYGLLSMLKS